MHERKIILKIAYGLDIMSPFGQGKIELFSREGQIFPGGSNFDIFPGNCKISKFTMC